MLCGETSNQPLGKVGLPIRFFLFLTHPAPYVFVVSGKGLHKACESFKVEAFVFLEYFEAVITSRAFMPTLSGIWKQRVKFVTIVFDRGRLCSECITYDIERLNKALKTQCL